MKAIALRRERNCSRLRKGEAESSEHHKVSVKPDALDATDAEEGESVFVLQASKFSFYGGAALVERGPFRCATLYRRARAECGPCGAESPGRCRARGTRRRRGCWLRESQPLSGAEWDKMIEILKMLRSDD